MNKDQWLQRIATTLVREGMPIRYVKRCCEELAEHWHDCEPASSPSVAVDQRMGGADDLSAGLVVAYRRSRWIRRVPTWLYCLSTPLVAVGATLLYYVAVGWLFSESVERLNEHWHPVLATYVIWGLYLLGKLAPPLAVGWLMAWSANWLGKPTRHRAAMIFCLSLCFLIVASRLQIVADGGYDLALSCDTSGLSGTGAWMAQILQASCVLFAFALYQLPWQRHARSVCEARS